MLVLTRYAKRGEHEWIDVLDQDRNVILSVCVVEVRGDKVRLGFEAGRELEIVRRELLQLEGK